MKRHVSCRPFSIEARPNRDDRAGSDIKAIPINPLQANQAFRSAALTCRNVQQWRCLVEALTTRILMTSIVVAMLVGTEAVFAGNALDAAYGLQDRGMAVDAQVTDEEGLNRARVRVQPGDAEMPTSVALDEKQMERELNAIAKDLKKVKQQIRRGC
jgi:hypothetical protein